MRQKETNRDAHARLPASARGSIQSCCYSRARRKHAEILPSSLITVTGLSVGTEQLSAWEHYATVPDYTHIYKYNKIQRKCKTMSGCCWPWLPPKINYYLAIVIYNSDLLRLMFIGRKQIGLLRLNCIHILIKCHSLAQGDLQSGLRNFLHEHKQRA